MNKYLAFGSTLSILFHLILFFPIEFEKETNTIEIKVSLTPRAPSQPLKKQRPARGKKIKPRKSVSENVSRKSNFQDTDFSFLKLVRSEIERVKYKSIIAKRKKLKGEVSISFGYNIEGEVSNLKIGPDSLPKELKSSAKETIDRIDLEYLKSQSKKLLPNRASMVPIEIKIIYN